MRLASALLYYPLAAYLSLLLAVIAALYAAQVPPSLTGLMWLGVAVVMLHAEFLWPTFGIAAVLGVGSATWGSYLLLTPLEPLVRVAAALVGALLLLAAVARTMRLRTLPR